MANSYKYNDTHKQTNLQHVQAKKRIKQFFNELPHIKA